MFFCFLFRRNLLVSQSVSPLRTIYKLSWLPVYCCSLRGQPRVHPGLEWNASKRKKIGVIIGSVELTRALASEACTHVHVSVLCPNPANRIPIRDAVSLPRLFFPPPHCCNRLPDRTSPSLTAYFTTRTPPPPAPCPYSIFLSRGLPFCNHPPPPPLLIGD